MPSSVLSNRTFSANTGVHWAWRMWPSSRSLQYVHTSAGRGFGHDGRKRRSEMHPRQAKQAQALEQLMQQSCLVARGERQDLSKCMHNLKLSSNRYSHLPDQVTQIALFANVNTIVMHRKHTLDLVKFSISSNGFALAFDIRPQLIFCTHVARPLTLDARHSLTKSVEV